MLPKTNLKRKNVFELKNIQICSNCLVRGIYTSDNLYSSENLPKDMDFRRFKGKNWDEMNDFKYIPSELAMFQAGLPAPNEQKPEKKPTTGKKMRYDLERYQDKNGLIKEEGSEDAWEQEKAEQFLEGEFPDCKDEEEFHRQKKSS